MKRDFTYIDDIVEGLIRVIRGVPEKGIDEDGFSIPSIDKTIENQNKDSEELYFLLHY